MFAPINRLASWFVKLFGNRGGRRAPFVKRPAPGVRLQLETLEGRIVPTISIGVTEYETFAEAITAANANPDINTITIDTDEMPVDGYAAAVHITESVNIVGSAGAILKAGDDTSGSGDAVIYITGSSTIVNISDLSITGTGDGGDDFKFGIRVDDGAELHIEDSDFTDIIASAGWNGVAILIGSVSSTASADINNVTFTDYQLGGVRVRGEGSYAQITNSTFNGQYLTPNSQFGIRLDSGATADIEDNQIQDHIYGGESYNSGLEIIAGGPGTVVEGNTFYRNDFGVYNWITSTAIADATMIRGNTFTSQFAAGIFLDEGIANIQDNTITYGWYGVFARAYDVNLLDSIGVLTNNTISNSSIAATDTYDEDELDAVVPVIVTNHAPTFEAPEDRENFRGDVIEWQIDATDEDDDDLTYDATGLPTGLDINHTTGAITGSIASNVQVDEPYSVTFIVSDGIITTSHTFELTIYAAYVAVLQGDQYSYAGADVDLPLQSWFAEGHDIYYEETGLPSGLEIDHETGAITGTIDYGAESEEPYVVTITATDEAGGEYDEIQFNWYVTAAEILIDGFGDLESIVGASVEVPIIAHESSGADLTFSYTGLPPGLDIDTETGVISGDIDSGADVNSPYSVTIRATCEDGDFYEEISFTWTVRQLVLRNPGDREYLVGDTVGLEFVAPYAGVGTLTFSQTGLPTSLGFNTSTGEITGVLVSGDVASSPYSVTVQVADGTHITSQTFTMKVAGILFADPGEQFAVDDTEATLDLASLTTSLSGHSVSYNVTGLPGGTYSISGGVLTWEVPEDANENGPYTVTITATDTNTSASAGATFVWNAYAFAGGPPEYVPLNPTPAEAAGGVQGRLRFLSREMANLAAHRELIQFGVDFAQGIVVERYNALLAYQALHPNYLAKPGWYALRDQLRDAADAYTPWEAALEEADRRYSDYFLQRAYLGSPII